MEDKDIAVVVLPVALIEQNILHLLVFTDNIIAQEVLNNALALLADDPVHMGLRK